MCRLSVRSTWYRADVGALTPPELNRAEDNGFEGPNEEKPRAKKNLMALGNKMRWQPVI